MITARRSFIKQLLLGAPAMVFIPKLIELIWKPSRLIEPVSYSKFTEFLLDQQPVYDRLILQDIRPTDGWLGHVNTATFDSHEHTMDRFSRIYPCLKRDTMPIARLEDCAVNDHLRAIGL